MRPPRFSRSAGPADVQQILADYYAGEAFIHVEGVAVHPRPDRGLHRGDQHPHRLPAFQRKALNAQVQGRGGAVTPYAWWVSRWGLAPLWALGLGLAAWAWLRRRRH